jgi:hypothetical protein
METTWDENERIHRLATAFPCITCGVEAGSACEWKQNRTRPQGGSHRTRYDRADRLHWSIRDVDAHYWLSAPIRTSGQRAEAKARRKFERLDGPARNAFLACLDDMLTSWPV